MKQLLNERKAEKQKARQKTSAVPSDETDKAGCICRFVEGGEEEFPEVELDPGGRGCTSSLRSVALQRCVHITAKPAATAPPALDISPSLGSSGREPRARPEYLLFGKLAGEPQNGAGRGRQPR